MGAIIKWTKSGRFFGPLFGQNRAKSGHVWSQKGVHNLIKKWSQNGRPKGTLEKVDVKNVKNGKTVFFVFFLFSKCQQNHV